MLSFALFLTSIITLFSGILIGFFYHSITLIAVALYILATACFGLSCMAYANKHANEKYQTSLTIIIAILTAVLTAISTIGLILCVILMIKSGNPNAVLHISHIIANM